MEKKLYTTNQQVLNAANNEAKQTTEEKALELKQAAETKKQVANALELDLLLLKLEAQVGLMDGMEVFLC